MMIKRFSYIFLILLIPAILFGQEEPKREIRSTWIASVGNIDWPKSEHRNNAAAQKADLISMLQEFKETNMNAVFLQVRPECDALYQSAYEPWSRYLTWTQGDDPGYDPLQFAIDEGHKLGIEVHVWLNPYRINASASDGGSYYHPTHVYKEHPEWALEYETGKKILNPGLPEVMSYIGDIVRDILSKYEVDGVHFDDYFYSYDGTPASLDATTYTLYGGGMSLNDWRRDNVNRMVDTVYTAIQETNPNVRFGISPFGIYRNGVPSGIIGFDAYSTIYCDPLAWLRDGSVDYLTPQTYWPTGGSQDFETLVSWWGDSCFKYGRHLYPGMGTYRLSVNPGEKKAASIDPFLHESKYYFDLPVEDETYLSKMEESLLKSTSDPVGAWNLSQIGTQINLIRANNSHNALGSVFFSAKDMRRVAGLKDYLTENSFTYPAIIPEMTWKSNPAPLAPQNLKTDTIDSEFFLSWDFATVPNGRFAVYVASANVSAAEMVSDRENLQAVSFNKQVALSELVISENAYAVVTAISATGKEGPPSDRIQINNVPYVTLISPASESTVGKSNLLSWSSDFVDPQYQLQIAANETFSTIAYTSAWTTNTSFSIANANLKGEKTYYWRVRAKSYAIGPYSGAWSFTTGYPEIPELNTPSNLTQNISTRPVIRWNSSSGTENIRVQISEQSNFSSIFREEVFPASSGEGTLTQALVKDTWYYIRISGENTYGESEFTDFNTFSTTSGEIPTVELLEPSNLSVAASYEFLKWQTTATTGSVSYTVEVALDAGFSSTIYNSGWIRNTQIAISELQIEGRRTYYWRAKAKSEFGESDYSAIWVFETGYPTRPSIISPGNLSEGNSAQTIIAWQADNETDSICVELSKDGFFEALNHVEKFEASLSSDAISVSLAPLSWYFLRIKAENEYGSGVYSATKYFKTDQGTSISAFSNLKQKSIAVYPTIVRDGELSIKTLNADTKIIGLSLIDPSGRELIHLEHFKASDSEFKININTYGTLTNGTYFLRVQTNEKRVTLPLIVLND